MENQVNVHTVDLSAKEFNDVVNFGFIIIENREYETGDYVLFRQCEKSNDGEITNYTGQNQMFSIKSINSGNAGLKEDYVILMLGK